MEVFEKHLALAELKSVPILKKHDIIVVGFSGGPDSTALLHFLVTLKKQYGLKAKIIAAHVNHMLRGAESERDEIFVRDFCEERTIKLEILKIDINKKSQKIKKGLEETARIVRYTFFHKLADQANESAIAVAHTHTDSIETAVFNFTRGTGIDGIRGISEVNGKIWRPFLSLTKKDTIKYCKNHKLNFVTDSSNDLLLYKRNIIRHKVLPAFAELNKSFENSISRTFELLREDSIFLNDLAKSKVKEFRISYDKYSLKELRNLPFSILSRSIRIIIENFCKKNSFEEGSLSYKVVNLVIESIKKGTGCITVKKNVRIRIYKNLLEINQENDQKISACPQSDSRMLKDMLTDKSSDFIITVLKCSELASYASGLSSEVVGSSILDYDVLPDDCVFRGRLPGDHFSLVRRMVTKKLKKFLNELGFSVDLRGKLRVIAKGKEVFWLEKVGASRSCCYVEGKTRRVLFIKRRCDIFG